MLLIDTDAGTVSVDGNSQMSTLVGASVPVQDWVLGAGVNDITFETATGSATASIFWRDAIL
jgi:hypothetical protein